MAENDIAERRVRSTEQSKASFQHSNMMESKYLNCAIFLNAKNNNLFCHLIAVITLGLLDKLD